MKERNRGRGVNKGERVGEEEGGEGEVVGGLGERGLMGRKGGSGRGIVVTVGNQEMSEDKSYQPVERAPSLNR